MTTQDRVRKPACQTVKLPPFAVHFPTCRPASALVPDIPAARGKPLHNPSDANLCLVYTTSLGSNAEIWRRRTDSISVAEKKKVSEMKTCLLRASSTRSHAVKISYRRRRKINEAILGPGSIAGYSETYEENCVSLAL
ncbi:hypothetical protein Bbelb_339990 [Branchiostoma belcheri]|nr:hypothetical protein Bbelb_339990 [Branchiostoma belcheri]